MRDRNSSKGPVFDLRLAVKHGLEAIEHGSDFTTTDVDKSWEMIVVRKGGKTYLSIKSWEPDLLKKLYENFNIPGYTANFRSSNGCHLAITKE